ncbi:amino acid ABC transporter ATP-binding protein [Gilliamella apicola]|uniref:amino acid ABC transporter ATP-binding protein n=1 Tax=Gilliamella apicola TaxID=1196095 RepID=UPI000D785D24|nr:amino acid ABC transporter ATP-binding protein [Gilliamella apicola]PXY98628.1 amino acid ABC transporter ATP-binding protein [Gilliamella apicola]WLS92046.1 amino acid ABC transporter ATP-binding protein [Gilliamella apicola]
MISVSHLSKRFANNEVLKDINLNIKQGEVVAIIGPSGSGKSTLLRCLNLLEKPNTGTIKIGSVALNSEHYHNKDEINLRKQSAMVFQHYNLFKNKTALENITYPLIVGQKIGKDKAKQQGLSLLERVGMLPYANQFPITLSGGQQQRIAIARALAVRPKVLLFDEPTSALDPERVHEVLQVMLQLAKEHITMIIVTHEMEFAKYVADRIIFMANGVIIEEGPAKSIIDNPQHELTQRFLRQITDEIDFEI